MVLYISYPNQKVYSESMFIVLENLNFNVYDEISVVK